MLSTLLRVMLPGNAKAIMNWDRVNSIAYDRINITKGRFVNGPIFYSGMHQIFRHLLLNIDFVYLKTVAESPMAYYLPDLVPKANVIKKLFDTVSISTENYGMLMDRSNQPVIPEIWVSTSRRNPLYALPLDGVEWQKWCNVRCAIVFSYDTPLLNVDFLTGTLKFPSDIAPTYGLVGVDIPVVWLKFISWWLNIGSKRYGREEPQPSDIDDYIHQVIMVDFYEDFFRIFTLNSLKLLVGGDFDNWKIADETMRKDWRIAMSGFGAGCCDLIDVLGLVKTRGVTVEDFLSTLWLKDKNKKSFSIRQLMEDYTLNWTIPDQRQYHWITMLRDLDVVLITAQLLKLSPSYPIGERTKKELLYKMNTYERAVPWGHVHNPSLKAKLQNSFSHIRTAIEF